MSTHFSEITSKIKELVGDAVDGSDSFLLLHMMDCENRIKQILSIFTFQVCHFFQFPTGGEL